MLSDLRRVVMVEESVTDNCEVVCRMSDISPLYSSHLRQTWSHFPPHQSVPSHISWHYQCQHHTHYNLHSAASNRTFWQVSTSSQETNNLSLNISLVTTTISSGLKQSAVAWNTILWKYHNFIINLKLLIHTCHGTDRISAPFLHHLRWHTRFELISFWSEVSWSLFKQDSNQSTLIYSLTLVQTTCMVALLFQISEIM